MDLELDEYYDVTFTDPDVVKYAESFGANGYRISSAGELLPTPRTALGEDVSIIACASTTQRTSVFPSFAALRSPTAALPSSVVMRVRAEAPSAVGSNAKSCWAPGSSW